MKKLKTFKGFINESRIDEGKYDNTWYNDIVTAKFQDANWNKYAKGLPLNRMGPGGERAAYCS